MQFRKAVKYAAKGRVALIGPAGSGKSYTMLTIAQVLAAGGTIAAVDTEHGSLSKYADLFAFDVIEMDSYSPKNFLDALRLAEQSGYAAFCCDSLSHFWVGKDGALEFVDEANARQRDKMSGWKDFRPHERAMIDAMIASPCHIITTMRTKTAYQDVEENGKKKRVKIGLAPVQRDGMEYEFDLVGYMDDENTLIIDKTRCPEYSGRAIRKPTASAFAPFASWLAGAVRKPDPPKADHPPTSDKPPLMATAYQIAKLAMQAVQLGKEEAAACAFASSGKASTWAALTSEQAETILTIFAKAIAKLPKPEPTPATHEQLTTLDTIGEQLAAHGWTTAHLTEAVLAASGATDPANLTGEQAEKAATVLRAKLQAMTQPTENE